MNAFSGKEFIIRNDTAKRVKGIPSQQRTQTKRNSSRTTRSSFARYLKFGVVGLVVIGAVASQFMGVVSSGNKYVAPQARLQNPIEPESAQPVDEVVAAEVAATVAGEVGLAVTPNVTNRADTLDAQVKIASTAKDTTTAVVEKPQLIVSDFKSAKDIKEVVAKDGETVPVLAKQYGISEDTVRWANNLTSDALTPGQKLTILPVTGVVYTTVPGDTADVLADKFKASAEQITVFNNLETSGMKEGIKLIIPNGIKPVEVVKPVVSSRTSTSVAKTSTVAPSSNFSFGSGTVYAGNRYAYGYCTWYAYNKRAAIGRVIGSNWGNATTWASLARASGFAVDKNPQAGDVFQTSGGWGGYGHVGFVERINDDGSVSVSEMNYAGWNVVSTRTIPASQVGTFNYIH